MLMNIPHCSVSNRSMPGVVIIKGQQRLSLFNLAKINFFIPQAQTIFQSRSIMSNIDLIYLWGIFCKTK